MGKNLLLGMIAEASRHRPKRGDIKEDGQSIVLREKKLVIVADLEERGVSNWDKLRSNFPCS